MMDRGLLHRVVCPFTPQLSLVLINRPRRDGTLSWRWYTTATDGIRTRDLVVTSHQCYLRICFYFCFNPFTPTVAIRVQL